MLLLSMLSLFITCSFPDINFCLTSSVYFSYLFFQLYSHATLYEDSSDDVMKSKKYAPRPKKIKKDEASSPMSPTASTAVDGHGSVEAQEVEHTEEEEEVEEPQMSVYMALGLLAVVTVVSCACSSVVAAFSHRVFPQLVAVTAEWLVDSINGLVATGGISKEFVGVILLPIVGNAAGMSHLFSFRYLLM